MDVSKWIVLGLSAGFGVFGVSWVIASVAHVVSRFSNGHED